MDSTRPIDEPNPMPELTNHHELNLASTRDSTSSRTEEEHFSEVFQVVLEEMKNTLNVDDEDIEEGISTVINAFRGGRRWLEINFELKNNLCAYFLRYGQLSVEVSRYLILGAVNECQQLQACLKSTKDTLNVINLGGGPGFDIVGFCSAVYPILLRTDINFKVVDRLVGWTEFFKEMMERIKNGDFGNASKLFKNTSPNPQFEVGDLTSGSYWKNCLSECVKKADIVLMKALMSILPEEDNLSTDKKDFVARKVIQAMKVGALLLFIDSPNYDFSVQRVMQDDQLLRMENIYTSIVEYQPYNTYEIQVNNYSRSLARSSNQQITIYMKIPNMKNLKRKHDV